MSMEVDFVNFVNTHWPLNSIRMRDFRKKVFLDVSFNRWAKWTAKQKRRFIQSLISGKAPSPIIFASLEKCLNLSIPDSSDYNYFKNLIDKGYQSVAMDGNNRTITIDEYLRDLVSLPHGKYALPSGTVVINDSNDLYSTHPAKLKEWIDDNITINAIEYTVSTKQALSDCFNNINDGSPLNRQEKRNAILVPFADAIRKISEDYMDAFRNIGFKNNIGYKVDEEIVTLAFLYAYDVNHVIKNDDLDDAYRFESDTWLKLQRGGRKVIETTLQMIIDYGDTNTKKVRKALLLNFFIMVREILTNNGKIIKPEEFFKWFVATENARENDPTILVNTRTGKSLSYKGCCGGKTASDLTARYNVMMRDLENIPDGLIVLLDSKRDFTENDRYYAWEKQGGMCTLTRKTIPADEIYNTDMWHADHIVPHSKGGKTLKENCQLVCKIANLKKGAKMPELMAA